jgi:hypothetical protein
LSHIADSSQVSLSDLIVYGHLRRGFVGFGEVVGQE